MGAAGAHGRRQSGLATYILFDLTAGVYFRFL